MSGKAMFGPAGLSNSFGKRSSLFYPNWLREQGLDCFEYQCGRGLNIGEAAARKLGKAAADCGIVMSLHSPYFINLSSDEDRRIERNIEYVIDSVHTVTWMGGNRVVVHCGGLTGKTREEAFANTLINLDCIQEALTAQGLEEVRLCVETMGKVNTIGSLEEVLEICRRNERLLPCIDFGHLNARTHGGLMTAEALESLYDTMENTIGKERTAIHHGHFSKIEYSKGGEVRHLTFADRQYGPPFEALMALIARRSYTPCMICESAGTQAEDAVAMKKEYQTKCGY